MYTRANSSLSPQQQNSTKRTRIKLIGDLRQALASLICSVVEIFSPTKLKCCWDYGQRHRVSFFDQAERNLKSIDKKREEKTVLMRHSKVRQMWFLLIFSSLDFLTLSEKILKLLSSLLVVVVVSFPIILSPTLSRDPFSSNWLILRRQECLKRKFCGCCVEVDVKKGEEEEEGKGLTHKRWSFTTKPHSPIKLLSVPPHHTIPSSLLSISWRERTNCSLSAPNGFVL